MRVWGSSPPISLTNHKEIPYNHTTMIISKLTTKAQTTIPQAVRTALGLHPGDAMSYEIEDGRAVLMRYDARTSVDEPFGTFAEWDSEIDNEAYKNL